MIRLSGGGATPSAPKASIEIRCVPVGAMFKARGLRWLVDAADADRLGGSALGVTLYECAMSLPIIPSRVAPPCPCYTLLHIVAGWLPGRRIVVVADSSFAALAFLDAVRSYVTVDASGLDRPCIPRPRLGRPVRIYPPFNTIWTTRIRLGKP